MNFNIMSQAQPIFTKTKLYGLDPDLDYCDESTGQIYGGDELMEAGYYDSVMKRDFTSEVKYLIACKRSYLSYNKSEFIFFDLEEEITW